MIRRRLAMIALPALLFGVGCKGDETTSSAAKTQPANSTEVPAQGGAATGAATAKPEEESKARLVPSETERIALNTNGHEIPASIQMPKGSTIFADEPTSLRVGVDGKDTLGRRESLFAVRVRKGNAYNLDLNTTADELKKNAYGAVNEILEHDETLLLYKTTVDGFVSHSFDLVVTLGDTSWVCSQGNDGGWSEADVRAQLEACKTLEAL